MANPLVRGLLSLTRPAIKQSARQIENVLPEEKGLSTVRPPVREVPDRPVKFLEEQPEAPVEPLGIGLDEELLSGKAIKNYTEDDFNILDDLVSQGKATAGTKKANKLLNHQGY